MMDEWFRQPVRDNDEGYLDINLALNSLESAFIQLTGRADAKGTVRRARPCPLFLPDPHRGRRARAVLPGHARAAASTRPQDGRLRHLPLRPRLPLATSAAALCAPGRAGIREGRI